LREKGLSFRESEPSEHSYTSVDSTAKEVLTSDDCVVIFIDHQPQWLFRRVRDSTKGYGNLKNFGKPANQSAGIETLNPHTDK